MIATEYDELDRELGELSGEPGQGRQKSGLRLLPIAVGVISLLTLGGIIWYAYSQGVREGSETAAPLLAPEGTAKEAPLDPGGREIAGTELGIYNRVSGDQETASVERILPPPEEPRAPPADILQNAPAGTPNKAPAEPVAPVPPSTTDTTTATATTRAPVPAPDAVLAEPTAPPPTVGSETEEVAAAPVQPEPPAQPKPTVQEAAPANTAAASSAGNGWRIQIAALRNEADARAEWTKKQNANPDLLGKLAVQIQEATVNGTTYYRIRGGPLADGDAAKALCVKMKAKGVGCIPVAPGK
ncbi:MAG: SPOR domain-containing protein [Alphaproteobacteria bacterium]|nr:SPOR domain-containing protein [Alphaproteobacteria bacterium]